MLGSQFYRYSKWICWSWSTKKDCDESMLISSFQVFQNRLKHSSLFVLRKEKKSVNMEIREDRRRDMMLVFW